MRKLIFLGIFCIKYLIQSRELNQMIIQIIPYSFYKCLAEPSFIINLILNNLIRTPTVLTMNILDRLEPLHTQ